MSIGIDCANEDVDKPTLGVHARLTCKQIAALTDNGPHHLIATTIESGPTSGSTRVRANPASFIQPAQSAPV
jgi:hypothetical protein